MKVKLFTKLILIMALLAFTNTATLKRTKLTKKKEAITLVILILGMISTTTSVIAGEIKDSCRKEMMQIYGNFINQVEGIQRCFLNSMFLTCAYGINASTLNAGLLFQFRFGLEKFKMASGASQKSIPEQNNDSIESLIKRIKGAKKHSGALSAADKKNIGNSVENHFSTNITSSLSRMKNEMKNIVAIDMQTKEAICFGNDKAKSFVKIKQQAFDKMDKIGEELEDTSNFIELFRSTEDSKKGKHYRTVWLENAMKYAPEKGEELKEKFERNSEGIRIFKGCLYLIEILLPYVDGELSSLIQIGKGGYSVVTAGSFKAAVATLVEIIQNIAVFEIIKTIISKLLGKFAGMIQPVISIFTNIKTIIQSTREVSKLSTEMKSKVIAEGIDANNTARMSSLEVINMSHNSILSYKMLKLLTETGLKMNVATPEGLENSARIKEICAENFYLCFIKMGEKYIKTNFQGKKVCPKEILIEKGLINKDLLTRNKFILDYKTKELTGKYRIFKNMFFSVSNSSIVKIEVNQKVTAFEVKKAFVKDLKGISGFDQEKCKDVEKHTIVQELKLEENKIFLIRVKHSSLSKCTCIETAFCYKLEDVLKFVSPYRLKRQNSNIDLTQTIKEHPDSEIAKKIDRLDQGNNELALNRNSHELEILFLKNVCYLIEQPIKVFSDREKKDIKKIINKTFGITDDAKYKNNATKYKGLIKDMVELIFIKGTKFKISILDALMVIYNKVVDEKTVVFFKGEDGFPWVSFRMKDFNPDNDFEIMSYYSTGHKDCKSHQLIKNTKNDRFAYRTPIEVFKERQIGWYSEQKPGVGKEHDYSLVTPQRKAQIESDILREAQRKLDKVDKLHANFYSDFRSRFDHDRASFKVKMDKERITYKVSEVINKQIFSSDNEGTLFLNDGHSDFDNCSYTFQFAKVEIEDSKKPFGYKFEFAEEKDEIGFPKVHIKRAKSNELAFQPRFYIMLYSMSDDISKGEQVVRDNIFLSINKKLANFGCFGLSHIPSKHAKKDEKDEGVKIVLKRLFLKLHQGNIYTEVFVVPAKHKNSEENSSICSNVNKNK